MKTALIATIRNQIRIPLIFQLQGQAAYVDFITFHNLADNKEHIALGFNQWREQTSPLVRLHSECLTGDLFGSLYCDCGCQLNETMQTMKNQSGLLLYLRQEGRGIGLYNKLDAYTLQQQGQNTFEANQSLGYSADQRDYTAAAQMLAALEINKIKLLTNNEDKANQLQQHGIDVIGSKTTKTYCNKFNRKYLQAKVKYSKHNLFVQ